jgi:hypothetical protein
METVIFLSVGIEGLGYALVENGERDTALYLVAKTNTKRRRSLLTITLPNSTKELKSLFQGLDELLLAKALEVGRQWYKGVLEAVDDAIAEHRSDGLGIEHRRAVWFQTCLGAVRVERRAYREGKGKGQRRYLLDELLGMGRRDHTSLTVKRLALDLAAKMPYRRTAETLRKLSAIDLTHQTIWKLVAGAAEPYLEKAARELKWFTETGEIPSGEGQRVGRLMVEADGVMVSLQREKERKVEVKLGIAYEGWKEVSRDRYRTVNKTVHASISGGDEFWAGMCLKLQKRYDLAGVKQAIVGGDGASWVREGASYVGGHFQLDRYHLQRELTTALGRDTVTRSSVWQAIECGDVESGLQLLTQAGRRTRGEQAEKIRHACAYIRTNLSGVRDYRLGLGDEALGLRRTGAIEGNVDKLVARRMKNQGMSWSTKGIRNLLCVRLLVFEGKLAEWLSSRQSPSPRINVPVKRIRRLVSRLSMNEPDDWLKATLPALRGPHASRPWVNILKGMLEPSPL